MCDREIPVLFSISGSQSCLWLMLSRPLAQTHTACVHAQTHMYTLYLSIKVPQHCSQIKKGDWIKSVVTWICQLWLFSNMALCYPAGKEKKKKNRKRGWHRRHFFAWTTVKKKTYVNKESSRSFCWHDGVTHDSVQHLWLMYSTMHLKTRGGHGKSKSLLWLLTVSVHLCVCVWLNMDMRICFQ